MSLALEWRTTLTRKGVDIFSVDILSIITSWLPSFDQVCHLLTKLMVEQMHYLNPYINEPPDFRRFCQKDSKLAELINFKESEKAVYPNFKDSETLRAITESTLRHDFGIKVCLKENRLCPIVPNRLDYLAWIEELIQGLYNEELSQYMHTCIDKEDDEQESRDRSSKRRKYEVKNTVRILDVGTGSSCIYPLLGCALHPHWEFIATDIDVESLENAEKTIADSENNDEKERVDMICHHKFPLRLASRITLLQRRLDQKLLLDPTDMEKLEFDHLLSPGSDQENLLYHVSMCNPPFYSSEEEMDKSLNAKASPPNAVCNGSANEMVCEGGEFAFISQMIKESKELASNVIWFTSLIGKKADMNAIGGELIAQKVSHFNFTEFIQGKTKRWAVAWTFTSYRSTTLQRVPISPLPNDGRHKFHVNNRNLNDITLLSHKLQNYLTQSHCHVTRPSHSSSSNAFTFIIFLDHNTWSRKARRLMSKSGEDKDSQTSRSRKKSSPVLGVRADLQWGSDDVMLDVTWIFGRDRQLFDSFSMSILSRWAKDT